MHGAGYGWLHLEVRLPWVMFPEVASVEIFLVAFHILSFERRWFPFSFCFAQAFLNYLRRHQISKRR